MIMKGNDVILWIGTICLCINIIFILLDGMNVINTIGVISGILCVVSALSEQID
jgi:nicotinamide riboside transporter PnuC